MWSMALMVVIIGLSSCAAGLVGGMVGGGAAYNKNKLAASQSQEKVVPKLSPEDQRLYDHYFLDAIHINTSSFSSGITIISSYEGSITIFPFASITPHLLFVYTV